MSGDAVYGMSNKEAGFQSVKSKQVWHVEHTFWIRWLAISKILAELDFNVQKNIVLEDSPR